jgi:hypothetical protein
LLEVTLFVLQGSAVASERDQKEGFILGVKKGFEIGSEVGFFQSFAQVWIKLVQAQSEGQNKKNQKVKSELEKLAQLAAKASGQVPIQQNVVQLVNCKRFTKKNWIKNNLQSRSQFYYVLGQFGANNLIFT